MTSRTSTTHWRAPGQVSRRTPPAARYATLESEKPQRVSLPCTGGVSIRRKQSGAMRSSGTGTMTRPRSGHVVITLNDGRVLAIAGTGQSDNGIGTISVNSATTSELYDPEHEHLVGDGHPDDAPNGRVQRRALAQWPCPRGRRVRRQPSSLPQAH